MPGPPPVPITISPPQQAILDRWLRQHRAPQALVRRIQIVMAAAAGLPNEQIAQQCACAPKTVRRWRARWAAAAPDLAAMEGDDPCSGYHLHPQPEAVSTCIPIAPYTPSAQFR